MRSEFELEVWQLKADETFEQLKDLDGKQQISGLRKKSNEFQGVHERQAFENLVFGRLKAYQDAKKISSPLERIFSAEGTAILAGFFALLLSMFEFNFGYLWSFSIAAASAILVRLVYRTFDRAFLFRRLFSWWLSGGLLLLGVPTLAVIVNTEIGSVQWGGPPSGAVVAIYIVVFLTLAALAFWEAHKSNT